MTATTSVSLVANCPRCGATLRGEPAPHFGQGSDKGAPWPLTFARIWCERCESEQEKRRATMWA